MKFKCPNCKNYLSENFVMQGICPFCKKLFDKPITIETITEEIIRTKLIKEEWLEFLKYHNRETIIKIFIKLYQSFIENKELDENEIQILEKLKDYFNLTNEEINYEELILPYIYVNIIRQGKKLPVFNINIENMPLILKKNEEIYFAASAILKELKTVNLGYEGGSSGISIKIMKGVYYRVGGHKGYFLKDEKLIETSRGVLLLTNKRLFLYPYSGYKHFNIPLNKIISYKCFQNGIEIYREDRQKAYCFCLEKSWNVEIIGLCLGYLLTKYE